MTKQHLEGYLSRSLKALQEVRNTWYLKLQVMPLAHTNTPADFIVLTEDKRYLIECKETKSKAFSFNRLTQEFDLKAFQDMHKNNISYILLMFWKGRLKKSYIFCINIDSYKRIKFNIDKKSINIKDLLSLKTTGLVKIIKVKDNRFDLKNILS